MQVYLTSLGCRLNEAELQTWAQQFNQAGLSIASKVEDAQLIVMNSCAVTQEAVRKSRQSVRRLKRNNPDAKLIVSGCYASLNTEQAAQLLEVDLVITNADKDQLCNLGLELLDSKPAAANQDEYQASPVLFQLGRQRAFIKVQDGCRYKCTFCIVTVARGEEKSRSVADIIHEINNLGEQGVQEIVLTGVHLGGYGHDVQSNLPALIQTILDETSIPRIRMGSLEPWELSEQFFQVFDNPRIMPHLHLPMQSGSDTVLKRMARRCKTADFAAMIKQLRTHINHLNVTTDIIAGFPGETEAEWRQTLNFVEDIQFGGVHIFPYSPRKGTKAATLPNQIHPSIRKDRVGQLSEISKKLKTRSMQSMLNQTVPVLWEAEKYLAEENRSLVFGYTPNYIRVAIDSRDTTVDFSNSIKPVKLINVSKKDEYISAAYYTHRT